MNSLADLAAVRQGQVLHEKMRIAGVKVGGDAALEVRNPYTGALVGTVPRARAEDIRRAFATARAYRPKLTRYERYRILYRTSELIRERAAALLRDASDGEALFEVIDVNVTHITVDAGAELMRLLR